MRARPGAWLRGRLVGLLTRPPLGYFEEPTEQQGYVRRHPIWPNRVQRHFYGPAWGDKTA